MRQVAGPIAAGYNVGMPDAKLATLVLLMVGLLSFGQTAAPSTQPDGARRHVVIVSIDGLRPDVLLRAEMPRLRTLMQQGSFTMWAKTTPQSITLPSHVSMLTGVDPNVHGIQWNGDLPLAEQVFPAYPTLFQLAQRAGYTTAMATGKSKMVSLTPPASLDWKFVPAEPSSEDPTVMDQAVTLYSAHLPDVFFVHLPTVDNVGHAAGWGTQEQLDAAGRADTAVGKLLDAIDQAGRRESTLIIITADHGGAGRTHGPEDPRSRSIPWIAVGPGVRADFDLTRFGKNFDIQTYDTFSTACYFLNITPPKRVEGKPIREMFDDAELTKSAPPKPRTPATQVH